MVIVAMDTLPELCLGRLLLTLLLFLASTDNKASSESHNSPSVAILGAADLNVAAGDPLNLTCILSGDEDSGPWWFHEDKMVTPSSTTHLETELLIDGSRRSTLTKSHASPSDEGTYACTVADASRASVAVHVLDAEEDGGATGGSRHRPPPVASPGGCINLVTGVIQANGDEWPEDPCITCRCEGGAKKCHAYMCHTTCINPRRVAEECCPVCDSTSVVTLPPHCPSLAHCSLKCHQGLMKDKDGCPICQCQAEECMLDCQHGYSEDVLGNKLCECASSPHCPPMSSCKKNCVNGLRTNRHGCPICKCYKCRRLLFSSPIHVDGALSSPSTDGSSSEGSQIETTSHGVLLLCAGPCLHGYARDERGCPTCSCNDPPHSSTSVYSAEEITKTAIACISSDGVEKSVDDIWWDGCRKCQCIEGVESCSTASCPSAPPTCDHPIIINGHCCPVCSEPVTLIAVGVLCVLLLVVLIVLAVRIRHYVWWPRRGGGVGGGGCLRFGDEDGGVRVLGASPSPTDSPQPNGIIKYDISALNGVSPTGGIKGIRRSGEYYESVPRYEPTLGDCDKSALAPH